MHGLFIFTNSTCHAARRKVGGLLSFTSGLGLGLGLDLAGLGPEPSRWSGSPFILTNNNFGQTGRGKTASSSSSSGSGLQVGVWVWYSGSLFYYLDSLNKAAPPIAIWILGMDVPAGMLAGRAHAKQSLMNFSFYIKVCIPLFLREEKYSRNCVCFHFVLLRS